MTRSQPVLVVALAATALLTLATPRHACAQSTVDQQQVRLSQIQTKQRLIALRYMALEESEAPAFLIEYDAYQTESKKILDRAVALMEDFASNYSVLTDDNARRLLKEWFRLQQDEDRLIRTYARRMGKTLPPHKVLRFVQIENRLNSELRIAALQRIPLAQ